MTTITTDGATSLGGSRRVAYDSNGNIWVMVHNATAGNWEFWYSTDDGATWTENTSLALSASGSTSVGAFTINRNGNIAVAYVNSTALGTAQFINGLTTSSSAWTTVASTDPTGVVADVVTFQKPSSSNWIIAAATPSEVEVYEVTSAGVYVSNLKTGGGGSGISLDFNHTGDGCTVASSSPHIYVSYVVTSTTPDYVNFYKLNWTGSGYSATAPNRNLGDAYGTWTAGAFDGTRYVVAVAGLTAGTVQVYQRDAADTTTTDLGTTADLGGAVDPAIVSISNDRQDVYVIASDGTNDDVDYVKWTRATATWDGSWTAIADGITIEGPLCLTATKSQPGSDIAVVWDQTTGDTVFDSVNYNIAPTGATWVTPVDGSSADEAATLACTWTFNDPNPADTQGAYSLKRTISAVVTYYQASDSSWQVGEIKNTSTTNGVTLPATWGADGESVTLAVKTWDQSDEAGVYGSNVTVLGSTPVTPVLTVPAAAATLTADTVSVTWTATEQTAYRLRILDADNSDAQVYDTGKITSTVKTIDPVAFTLTNSHNYKVEVRVWNDDDLVGPTDTHAFDVAFVEPATPTYVVSTGTGYIRVAITDPTPGVGEPTVVSHDVYVRVADGGRQDGERTVNDDGIRIAAAVTTPYDDYAAGSGINYQYRTRAIAENGTGTFGAWT